MSNVLSIATSGLLAFQQSIAVTGNNITNVDTDGYTRQVVDLASRNPTKFGGSYYGNGVDVVDVRRLSDELAHVRLRDATSLDGYLSQFSEIASDLDALLSGENTSLSRSIQGFFSGLQSVVQTPQNIPARESFLSQANVMVSRFKAFDDQLTNYCDVVNRQVENTVSQINTLAKGLGEVNTRVVGGSAPSPELVDERDRLLAKLSELTSTNVIMNSDGTASVSIGTGQSLVVGGVVTPLKTTRDSADPRQISVVVDINSTTVDITPSMTGGELGGLLAVRNEMIKPAQNTISRMALGLAQAFNDQHQLGMDLRDNIGNLFFSDINTTSAQLNRVLANSHNTGNANLAITITDCSQLSTSDYRLAVTSGPTYKVTRLSDNTVTTVGSFPASIDGFTLSIASGSMAVGDSFILAPTRSGAGNLSLNVTQPGQVALASPIRTASSQSNTGTGIISAGRVVDTSTSAFTTTANALSPPVRIEFLSPTTYRVVNGSTSALIEGPITYNPAISNDVFPTPGAFDPGYRIELSGAPQAGDSFTISYNNGGVGDNRNALALNALQSTKIFENGTATVENSYGALMTQVGSRAHQTDLNLQSSHVLLKQAQSRVDSLSGVNLDEETANMLRFEQAYQATAQIINVASRLFEALLGSMH